MKKQGKKSVVRRLFWANVWVFLLFLAALAVTLWALGLWQSIFAFVF